MGKNVIMITGATGFVGWNLGRAFAADVWDVIATYRESGPVESLPARWVDVSMTDKTISRTIHQLSPSVIIHCAAVPGIARCNQNRKLAFRVNVEATRRIAEAAESLSIPMVFLSTDLVFDGQRGWYAEDDSPNPPSYYGETKLLGEQEVLALCSRSYVLRLALCFGQTHDGLGGFLKWTYGGLRAQQPLRLYINQFRSLLFVEDIGPVTNRLLHSGSEYGIYHLGGPERLSRYDIGTRFADRIFGSADGIIESRLDRGNRLGDIDDTSLVTSKVREATGFTFTGFNEGIESLHLTGIQQRVPQ